MRIWTMVSQKGGAAKTTSALNLAVAACEAGEKVLVIDCDPQLSASHWWESRDENAEGPAVIKNDPGNVRNTISEAEAAGFTHVLIDTPGHAGIQANQSAQCATLCIVPTQPSIIDMRSTVPTVEMLKAINQRFIFLMTRCPVVGSEASEASESFSTLGLVCRVQCMERKAYKRAYAAGLGVTEYADKNRNSIAAATEIRAIYQWIKNKEDKLVISEQGLGGLSTTNHKVLTPA